VQASHEAADAEFEEQQRVAAQRAAAGSAFAELSATAASSSPVLEVEVAAAQEGDDAHDAPEEPDLPVVSYRGNDTDMASLFRELSSLGMEDAPEPPAPRPAAPRPAPAAPAAKKKKGLFGR
jgi:hypothetical protein